MRNIGFLALILFCVPIYAFAQTAGNTVVDFVIETDTFVPPFYEGRAEPTPGSVIRAVAILENVPDMAIYSYRWEVNGNVLSSNGPIAEFPAPFGHDFSLRIDVLDAAGRPFGSKEQIVALSDSDIRFYPTSLLNGTGYRAIGTEHILIEDEVSVRAVPYFMNRTNLSAGNSAWSLDGRDVEGSDVSDVITLRRGEGSGRAIVEFTVQNIQVLTQYATRTFTLVF